MEPRPPAKPRSPKAGTGRSLPARGQHWPLHLNLDSLSQQEPIPTQSQIRLFKCLTPGQISNVPLQRVCGIQTTNKWNTNFNLKSLSRNVYGICMCMYIKNTCVYLDNEKTMDVEPHTSLSKGLWSAIWISLETPTSQSRVPGSEPRMEFWF